MNGEAYDDAMESDFADFDESDMGEMDEMLDGLVDARESDFTERKRRGRGRRRGGAKAVPAARGGNAYRPPAAAAGGAVNQQQLQDALTRVGADAKRNGEGIKTINTRLGGLTTRVDDVVSVNQIQSRAIGKLDKQMKIDGALELAESFTPGGISAFQLLKGAVKSGLLGEGKGPLGNPLVIGGIGLVLNNPGILGGLLPRPNP